MKVEHLLKPAVVFLGVMFGICVVTISHRDRFPGNSFRFDPALNLDQGQPASIGLGEDLEARERYEWMRLHDPATGKIPDGIREKELAFASTLPKKEQSALLKGSAVQAYTWSARGPYNVGGRTRALGIDVTNTNLILAGGVSGGMWRTIDAGTSWTRTTDIAALQSVSCLVQDIRSGKTNIWYYGTGELFGNSASGGGGAILRGDGIFKSTNSGQSWTKLSFTSTNVPQSFDQVFDYVWNVAIDPSNSSQDEVYAATLGSIQRSTDGGVNWTPARGASTATAAASDSRYTDIAVTSTGVVYAGMSQASSTVGVSAASRGIWRSTDGITWTSITPASFPTQYSRMVVGVAASNENIVYVLVTGTNGTNGTDQINSHQFWKYTFTSGVGNGNGSEGNGGTWVNRGANLPSESGVSGNAIFDTQGGYDMLVKVKPDNPDFVILGSTNLYRSTDGFATTSNWKRIGGYAGPSNYTLYGNHHPDQHSGMFIPGSNVIFYSGHDGGVTMTSDVTVASVVWAWLNNSYTTSQFYTVTLDHGTSGDASVMGGLQDNGTWQTTSTNPIVAWTSPLGGDGSYCAYQNGGAIAYASAQNAQIYKLTSSAFVRIDPTGGSYGFLFIVPLILDPNNNNIMYLNGDKIIWRNNDLSAILADNSYTTKSTNWDSLSTVRGTGLVTALAISKTPANVLYYGTTTSGVFKMNSANSGLPTPVDISTGKGFPSNAYVSCIAVDPNNASNAMVVFSNYSVQSLFYTTDGGTSWTNVSGNLEQNLDGTGNGPSCRWAVIHHGGTGTVYFVGTSTGLYSTSVLNGTSTSWSQEGSSTIGNVVVDMIDNRNSDGAVVVGTHGNGVFSATVITSVSQLPDVIPTEFRLMQNYPNPFNPSTTIRYSITKRGRVRLNVYDATGKQVATLVDQEQSAGTYEATWDAQTLAQTSVASGVYFARLEHGNRASTQKMMLLK